MDTDRNANKDHCDSNKRIDLFRDTWVRYLGYANEVGESFRALVHVNLVRFSYVVSCSYVLADAAHKGNEAKERVWSSPAVRRQKVCRAVGDTILWQGLASVAIPGFTINRLCAGTRLVLRLALPRVPPPARKWVATGVGLAAIPVIIHPIDAAVDWGMNHTVRRWYHIEDSMQVIVHHQRDCDTPDPPDTPPASNGGGNEQY